MSPSVHLGGGRLSAIVDGLAVPADVTHAAACAECSSRLATWQETHQLVATPPAPALPAHREVAVRAALSAVEHALNVPAAGYSARARPVPPVIPRRSPPTARALRVAAAAAALLVLGGGAVAKSRQSHAVTGSGPSHFTRPGATSPAGPLAQAGPNLGTGGRSSAASGAIVPGTLRSGQPLGNFGDAASLVAALRRALDSGPAGGVPPATSSATGRPAAPSPAAPSPSCAAAAVATVGGGAAPVLEDPLTYQGAAAQVFVFAASQPAVLERHRGVVLGTDGCIPLAELSF